MGWKAKGKLLGMIVDQSPSQAKWGGPGQGWLGAKRGNLCHKISESEVEQLQRYFTKILEFPEEEMEEERGK